MAKRSGFKDIISGKILVSKTFVRRLPVVLYISFLMLVYMTYNFSIQGRYEDMYRLKNEIKSLQTIYLATTVQRAKMTRREDIEKLLVKFKIKMQPGIEQPRIIE